MNTLTRIVLVLFVTLYFPMLFSQEEKQTAYQFFRQGEEQFFYGKFKEATRSLEKAVMIYKDTKQFSELPKVYNVLAKSYLENYQLDKVQFCVEKALLYSRIKSKENKREEANAIEHQGTVFLFRRKLGAALKKYEEALMIREKNMSDDKEVMAVSYYRLGKVYVELGKYEQAKAYLEKAFITNEGKTPTQKILQANIHEVIGQLHYNKREFDKALTFFEKTFEIAKEVYEKENPYFGRLYNELGVIYSIKEDFNASLDYYKKGLSVSISQLGVDHPEQMMIHFNMGTVYLKQHQKYKAIFHTEKALAMGLKVFRPDHENMFYPFSQLGQIYGDEKGIEYIEKALAICHKSTHKNFLRISYLHEYLAEIYMSLNNNTAALKNAQKTLDLRLRMFGEQNPNTIKSYNLVSKIYAKCTDYKNALLYNRKAIGHNYETDKQSETKTTESSLGNYLDTDLLLETMEIRSDVFLRKYKSTRNKEDLEEAILFCEKAIAVIPQIEQRKRNYDDRIKFSEIVKSIYARSIEANLLLTKEQVSETSYHTPFYYSEKSKATVLRAIAKRETIKKTVAIDFTLLNTEKTLNIQIARLNSQILKETTKERRDSVKLYKLEGELLDVSLRRDSVAKEIETYYPAYYKKNKSREDIITVSEVQNKLEAHTTLVEFFRSDAVLYVFIITNTTIEVRELAVPLLDKHIEELNNSITAKNHHQFIKKSRQLYRQLIAPIKDAFVGDRLVLIPDESLWHLPFDLLLTREEKNEAGKLSYLLFEYAISYANSASLLYKNNTGAKNDGLLDECLAFSYTSTDTIDSKEEVLSLRKLRDEKADLPGTRKEIKAISNIVNGKYYYHKSANEVNFKKVVNNYKLVHLALHGEIDHINPKNSKILFSDTEATTFEDNKLFSHELYALDIPAELVVLSACNTGAGKINKGEGILSVGNAFQYAGVKSLLLSKWEISDQTTPEVMALFYENLQQGMNKDKALQQAKVDFLKASDVFTEAPFYWGSFYVLGNTDAISFFQSDIYEKEWLFAWLLIFSGLGILFYWRKSRIHKKDSGTK
ncbi:CHAT domain-containing protein [Aquimarina sp. TRL1]|uniref:CHAT domain-containing protein n=1 Tax=Aquimarina sp. (strain TRL1) TaxID=2736252 RepID=UPI00158C996F|nr:CHAT domain-containing protein [Aquimarina sp. TRL1]QKX04035.1 CHAT domain-containing protein [Aquimarina sp. TRL1]